MSNEVLQKWNKHGRRKDLPKSDNLSPEERKALQTIRREAKQNGATLETNGKGGLDPSFALRTFRRNEWKCKRCGEKKSLTLHHVGGINSSVAVSKRGHKNQDNNVTVLCASCHNSIHEDARSEGIDSSQKLPIGDKGNARRNHGQPPYKPENRS